MKHAREDYNRIQDPALSDPSLLAPGGTPIGADEPVFLLRARDVIAPVVLQFWAQRLRLAGGEPATVQRVLAHAQLMRDWQKENGSKVPDCPEDSGQREGAARDRPAEKAQPQGGNQP